MKCAPIIPWPGGKRRLAKQLFPLFDNTHKTYIEPFAGAAAMLFLREQPARAEVLNDINGDLVNLYRCVQHHLDELVRQFRWQLCSREEFSRFLKSPPETLTDIQRAARFIYLQKTAFGGKMSGQTFGVDKSGPAGINLLRLEEELSAAHMRLARVTVENLPWQDVVRRYDSDAAFFFMDPPYWQTAGYAVPFGFEQYEQLAVAIKSMKGRALLTVNDHPDMRSVFDGLNIKRLTIKYSLASSAEAKSKVSGELAVRNY